MGGGGREEDSDGTSPIRGEKVFFGGAGHGLWDLSFPPRDSTQAPGVKASSPNHWSAREFPFFSFKLKGDLHKEIICLK